LLHPGLRVSDLGMSPRISQASYGVRHAQFAFELRYALAVDTSRDFPVGLAQLFHLLWERLILCFQFAVLLIPLQAPAMKSSRPLRS
jgi:hypothetical protein